MEQLTLCGLNINGKIEEGISFFLRIYQDIQINSSKINSSFITATDGMNLSGVLNVSNINVCDITATDGM